MARRSKRRRRRSRLVWVAVLLVATGFLVKRALLPRALDSLKRRPVPATRETRGNSPVHPANRETENERSPALDRPGAKSKRELHGRETLTDSDRRELDQVFNRKRK